jgi:2-methylisocitrate lyase-like PEP mutase family enzyme
VLYAPGLTTPADIGAAVVKAVAPKPVNVIMGLAGAVFSLQQLADLGVKRISVGSALARAALGALMRAADEMRTTGTFTFAREALPFAETHAILKGRV